MGCQQNLWRCCPECLKGAERSCGQCVCAKLQSFLVAQAVGRLLRGLDLGGPNVLKKKSSRYGTNREVGTKASKFTDTTPVPCYLQRWFRVATVHRTSYPRHSNHVISCFFLFAALAMPQQLQQNGAVKAIISEVVYIASLLVDCRFESVFFDWNAHQTANAGLLSPAYQGFLLSCLFAARPRW